MTLSGGSTVAVRGGLMDKTISSHLGPAGQAFFLKNLLFSINPWQSDRISRMDYQSIKDRIRILPGRRIKKVDSLVLSFQNVNEYQGMHAGQVMHAGMNDIEDCIKKGNELFENNRFLEFISFCKKITKKDIPDEKKAEIWYKISIAFRVLGSHANAVSAINKALSFNTDNPVYWVHKGDLLQSEKGHRYDDAINSYKTAARLSPKNPDPLMKLGLLYESRNNHQKAIETYNKALELNPDNPQIWYNKGFSLNSILDRKERERKLLQLTGDLSSEIQFMNEILITFKKVLELDPRNSDALYSIGVLYSRMKRYSDALQYFDEALKYYSKEDEKPTQIWYSKAEVLDKVGKKNEASELFEKYEEELKKDFEDFFRHHRIGYRV